MSEIGKKANADEGTGQSGKRSTRNTTRAFTHQRQATARSNRMSLRHRAAMIWLLLTFLGGRHIPYSYQRADTFSSFSPRTCCLSSFPAVASGQNFTSTSPPVYNETATLPRKLDTAFEVPSSSYSPTATAQAKTVTAVHPSKSSQFVKLTKPPAMATTTRHTVTQQARETALPGTFVMPSVDGLMGGGIRSSMESKATTVEDRTVHTPALAYEDSFTDDTHKPSTTTTTPAPSSTDSHASVTEGFSATMTSTAAASTTSTGPRQEDDISYLASLFPDLDLFEDSTPEGVASTLPSVPTTAPAADASTIQKPSGYNMSRERYCIAARYCYMELNERCVMRHMKSVCGCGRAFYRNPETLVCERKLPLLVSLELPEHSYVQEVADKKTLEFKAYESAAQHLVREEAEPLAFPPLARYEPEDQDFWKFYSTEPAPNVTEATTTASALTSQAS